MRATAYRRLCLCLLFLTPAFAVSAAASGQEHNSPSGPPGNFPATKEPVNAAGVKAIVDLPGSQHMKNTGGSDGPRGPGSGSGLCVFTSCEIGSRWHNIPELAGFQEWMTHHPGGGYPQKLDQMIAQFCKEKGRAVPLYVQHTGGDDAFLDLAMHTDRILMVTYAGFDGFYRDFAGRDIWIDHMVCLAHLDQEWAAIIDNNRPGFWVWMARKDFLTRWRARGGGWAVVFLAAPPPSHTPDQKQRRAEAGGEFGVKCRSYPVPLVGGRLVVFDSGKAFYQSPKDPIPAPVMVGQCGPNGCPLPPRTVPAFPNPFGPVYPAAPVVPAQMPAGGKDRYRVAELPAGVSPPRTAPPGPGWLWKNIPGVGDEWIQDGEAFDWGRRADGSWGWLPRPAPANPVESVPPAPAPAPVVGQDSLNFGIDKDKVHQRKTWHLCGPHGCIDVGKEDAHNAIAGGSLADDSDRWHLTAVGDPAFVSKFKADVAALPESVRGKLHVQGYNPGRWEIGVFGLPDGVSLRKPSPVRTSEQVGVLAAGAYSPTALADLLAPVSGVKPKPDPKQPDQPNGPGPQPDKPAPAPGGGVPVLLLVIGVVVLWLVLKK